MNILAPEEILVDNSKTQLRNTLLSDVDLMVLLSDDPSRVLEETPDITLANSISNFPVILFSLNNLVPTLYADNKAIKYDVTFDISVYISESNLGQGASTLTGIKNKLRKALLTNRQYREFPSNDDSFNAREKMRIGSTRYARRISVD